MVRYLKTRTKQQKSRTKKRTKQRKSRSLKKKRTKQRKSRSLKKKQKRKTSKKKNYRGRGGGGRTIDSCKDVLDDETKSVNDDEKAQCAIFLHKNIEDIEDIKYKIKAETIMKQRYDKAKDKEKELYSYEREEVERIVPEETIPIDSGGRSVRYCREVLNDPKIPIEHDEKGECAVLLHRYGLTLQDREGAVDIMEQRYDNATNKETELYSYERELIKEKIEEIKKRAEERAKRHKKLDEEWKAGREKADKEADDKWNKQQFENRLKSMKETPTDTSRLDHISTMPLFRRQ